jgi:hypothetical protein
MPKLIEAASTFWARILGDTATPGDGSSNTSPLRLDQYNSDIGNSTTSTAVDGDLQTIDTIAEAYTVNPAANTAGAASAKYSSNFLFRWLVQLVQNLRVQGNIAAGVTDSGNPLKAGGVCRTTLPTLADGQRGDLVLSSRSELYTSAIDFVSTPASITAADVASTTRTGQRGQVLVSGFPTAGSTVSIAVTGDGSFSFLVLNTFVASMTLERTLDNGTTWTAVAAFVAGTKFTDSIITGEGAFHGNCSSSTGLRLRCTSLTSGSPSIRLLAGAGTGSITVLNAIAITDRASGADLVIKPASTAALATDTAIVVTERPRSGTPTDRAGSTSATVNVWSTLMAANTTREEWHIQNPPDSAVLIQLGFGATASEIAFMTLAPGDAYGQSAPGQRIITAQLNVRNISTSAAKAYLAYEA